jgi:hypothetical protein
MPYSTVVTFTAGNALAAADLNNNFGNLDYLNAKINSQIQITAGAMISPTTYGATPAQVEFGTNLRNFLTMDFADGATVYQAEFTIVLPSDYNGGTMTAVFHWVANSTSTNSVVWQIAGRCYTDNDALDAAMGTFALATDANKSTAYNLNITGASSAITIAGTPAANKLCNFRIKRDPAAASDTLAATARLLAVVLTYTRS